MVSDIENVILKISSRLEYLSNTVCDFIRNGNFLPSRASGFTTGLLVWLMLLVFSFNSFFI